MKQKIFTLFLALAASAGTIFADGTKIGDLYYNLDATNKTAAVTYEKSGDTNYSGLTTANIPSSVDYESVTYSVTSIGDGAFRNCTGLTSVTIPNSVTSIGDGAFGFCTGFTSVTIPNSVTEIGGGAFWDCTGLTSVTIPNSVTSIGSFAFRDCTGLTSIEIPNSVTSIGFEAFYGCSGLTSATIPNSVTSIGYGAFGYCSGLTSVAIPNSVTSIGEYAFERCTVLTSITCEASTPPTCESGVFDGVDKSIPLYVPAESVEAYKAAYQWKDFGDNIKPIQAAEALDEILESSDTEVLKFIQNGQLFILRNGEIYNASGARVE